VLVDIFDLVICFFPLTETSLEWELKLWTLYMYPLDNVLLCRSTPRRASRSHRRWSWEQPSVHYSVCRQLGPWGEELSDCRINAECLDFDMGYFQLAVLENRSSQDIFRPISSTIFSISILQLIAIRPDI